MKLVLFILLKVLEIGFIWGLIIGVAILISFLQDWLEKKHISILVVILLVMFVLFSMFLFVNLKDINWYWVNKLIK